MDIHVYLHLVQEPNLDEKITAILNLEQTIMSAIEDLVANVQAQKNVVDSVVVAMQGLLAKQQTLSDQLAAAIAANDTTAIQQASQDIATNTAELQAAIPAIAQAVDTTPQDPGTTPPSPATA